MYKKAINNVIISGPMSLNRWQGQCFVYLADIKFNNTELHCIPQDLAISHNAPTPV